MPTVAVKKIDGSDAGKLELSSDVFEAESNPVVVREAANAFLSNQRQGTHMTKNRALVRGGGKKPWKQKGTGRARAGSNRSPIWVGGGTIFGPQPRSYYEKVNQKKKVIAFRSVLSARVAEENLMIVDKIDFSAEPKTKKVVEFLEKIGAQGRILIVTATGNESVLRATRNLPFAEVTTAASLNIHELLLADTVIVEQAAVEIIQERASK